MLMNCKFCRYQALRPEKSLTGCNTGRMCKDEYEEEEKQVKCVDCVNKCYEREADKTGCATGTDCAHEERERLIIKAIQEAERETEEDIPFTLIPSKTILSQTNILPWELEYNANKALAMGADIYIGKTKYTGFTAIKVKLEACEIDLIYNDKVVVTKPFKEKSIIIFDYEGEDIKITVDAQ